MNSYNQYNNQPQNYPGYTDNANNPPNIPPNQPDNNMPNHAIKSEPSVPTSFPVGEVKTEPIVPQNSTSVPFSNPAYGYQENQSSYADQPVNSNSNYPNQYPGFPAHLETKPPLGSASSGSPVTSWPITELKTEVDKLKAEEKVEMKSESDGEVKIEDLDTKKLVTDDCNKPVMESVPKKDLKAEAHKKESKPEATKTDPSESDDEPPRRGRPRKGKEGKKTDKTKHKGKSKAKKRKDRKTSKEKNDESESEDSEKEEKINREEELALAKKAEEMTYDWATELLKDYIPGIIENSAKMELFFYLLNESIKLGDRILLFSQSLFTLNLIEDFLEKNYIPGTNCLWERNTNYYRKYKSRLASHEFQLTFLLM